MDNAFTKLLFFATEPFKAFADTTSNLLVGAVIPIILSGLTISIFWQGVQLLNGSKGGNSLLELFTQNFRTVFVLLCALGSGSQYRSIVEIANELQTSLIVAGSPSIDSAGAAFDKLLDSLLAIDAKATELASSKFNLGPGAFTALIIMLVYGLAELFVLACLCFAFCETVAVQCAIYLITAVGPMFIATAAFKSTASYFSAWLSGLLRYTLEIAILLALTGIATKLIAATLDGISPDVSSGDLSVLKTGAAQIIITSILFIFLITRVHNIVGAMFGSASIQGIGAAAAKAIGGATGKGVDVARGHTPEGQARMTGEATGQAVAQALKDSGLTGGGAGTGTVSAGQKSMYMDGNSDPFGFQPPKGSSEGKS